MTDWDWWFDKLAGKPVEMNPSTPHAGFYRLPRKESYGARRTFKPVAYWPGENGQLSCRIGDEDVTPERGQEIWERVGNHPVTEEAYRLVAQDNGLWPDEHELVAMGDNLPPEDLDWNEIAEIGSIDPTDAFLIEKLQERIKKLSQEAGRRIEGPPIQDQDEANRLANLADALTMFHKIADGTRAREKKPHDEAAKTVQKKWAPVLLMAETYKNLKYKLLTPWLRRQEEAQKKQAEAAAAAGDPLAASETRRPRVGTRGRAMSLKSLKHAEITDYDACLNFFRESPDIKTTLQDLANRAVRAGITVPGVKVLEEQQAV